MTPERSAEAPAGATGCARGSQKCERKQAGFEPKPMSARPNTALRVAAGSAAPKLR